MKSLNEQELKITLLISKKEGEPVEVTARGKYLVESEGISAVRSIEIEVTGQVKSQIVDFGKTIVTLIKQVEEIPEE